MVSLEWAFGPATPFTLTARSTGNGFAVCRHTSVFRKSSNRIPYLMPVG